MEMKRARPGWPRFAFGPIDRQVTSRQCVPNDYEPDEKRHQSALFGLIGVVVILMSFFVRLVIVRHTLARCNLSVDGTKGVAGPARPGPLHFHVRGLGFGAAGLPSS